MQIYISVSINNYPTTGVLVMFQSEVMILIDAFYVNGFLCAYFVFKLG